MSVRAVNQTTGELDSIVAGTTSYASAPIGAILPFGGDTAPQGFMICNGAAVSRTTYSALFAVIGTSFGAGDGSTTFNIPDMREVVPVGAGTSTRSGIATHDTYDVGGFKDDQLQTHTHSITSNVSARTLNNRSPVPNSAGWTFFWGADNTNDNTGRTGTTTHGKQLGVNYIIKALQISLPTDFDDAVDAKLALKQDKLTDPLTRSNVVNNLTSSSTDLPLSAAMGKSLNTKVGVLGTVYTTNTIATNSAQSASFTLVGMSIANVPAGVYVISSTGRLRDGSACGGRVFLTLSGASQICLGHGSTTQGPAAMPWSVTSVVKFTGTTTIQATFYFEHSVSANVLSQGQLNAVRII